MLIMLYSMMRDLHISPSELGINIKSWQSLSWIASLYIQEKIKEQDSLKDQIPEDQPRTLQDALNEFKLFENKFRGK